MQYQKLSDLPHVGGVIGGGGAGVAAYQLTTQVRQDAQLGGEGGDYREMLVGPNEALLAQYQKCGQYNNEQLKNAKNLEQLVAIDIQSVDGAMAATAAAQGSNMGPQHPGGRTQKTYDPLHDPRHFPQPVPSMAGRQFLMNQAVLASSTPSYRMNQPGGIGADRFGPTSDGSRSFGAFGGVAQGPMALGLLPQGGRGAPLALDSKDLAPQVQGEAQGSGHVQKISDLPDSVTGAEPSQEADAQSPPADDPAELADPIKALKSIFKQKPKKKRAPLELNPVMNKYRQMSLRNARGAATKTYKEDYIPTNPNGLSNYGDELGSHGLSRTLLQGAQEQKASWQQSDNIFVQQDIDVQRVKPASESGRLGRQELFLSGEQAFQAPHGPKTTKHMDVRERLENLRKLFAEEDMQDAVKEMQQDWQLEDQQYAAERQRLISSAHLSTQAYSQANGRLIMPEDLDLPVHDLRRYLTTKIKGMQDRSDPNNLKDGKLTGALAGEEEDANGQKPRLQFKASTLTHIAELRAVGQEKIESQFIERLFREQTDYHYDKYAYIQQKEQSKKASEEVRRRLRAVASVGAPFPLAAPEQYQVNEAFTPTSGSRSHGAAGPPEQAERRRSRPMKTVNIVQQQLMRINRINRGVEKMSQEVQRPEEVDGHGAASSVTAAARPDGVGGSIHTNYTQSDMAPLGTGSAPQGQRPSPGKREGQSDFQAPIADNRGPEGGRQPPLLTAGSDSAANIPAQAPQPPMSEEGEAPVAAEAKEQKQDINQSPAAAGLAAAKPSTASKGKRSKDRTMLPMNSPQIMAPGQQPEAQTSPAMTNVGPSGVQLPGLAPTMLDEFRVSQLVRDYNMHQPDSPSAVLAGEPVQYLSDTDLFMTRGKFRQRAGLDSRGGGFRRKKKTDAQPQASGAVDVREAGYKYQQTKEGRMKLARARWPSDQLELLPEEQIALTHGSQFQYFCPKRFNRYPRFTIFFKRDQATGHEQNPYVQENTVSLSPQFLSYLMDRGAAARAPSGLGGEDKERPVAATTREASLQSQKPSPRTATKEENTDASKIGPSQQSPTRLGPAAQGSTLQAEDAVTAWNQNNELVQNYDPFERVVLVKGIDNQILTSFRTLKRENNTVSDTFKIVHQKFLPSQNRGLYFKSLRKNHADKFGGGLYSLTDNEEAFEIAQAELAESFWQQAEESQQQHKGHDSAALVDKSGIRSEANTTQLDVDEGGAGKPMRQQALAKPVQLASLFEGTVQDGGQRSRQQRAAPEQTGPSRESSIGPIGLRPAGAGLNAGRFDDAQLKNNQVPKVEEEGAHKRSKVVRKPLGQPKALAPYSYSLNAGDGAGTMAAQYEPAQKQVQGMPGAGYAPHSAATSGSQAKAAATNEAAEGTPGASKPNTQNKHQIEVKLSKVDPYRSAFPASSSFHVQGANMKKQLVQGGGTAQGQDLAMPSGQQQQLLYQGLANSTKRRTSQKGPAIGLAPSDRAAQGGGQAISTGRAGKKQLTVRASGGSGKGNVVIGQGVENNQRTQHLVVENREQAEPSASGQPGTHEASSAGAGGRLDSLRAMDEANLGKQKSRVRRDQPGQHGRGDQQKKPGEVLGEQESKYGKDFKMPELPPLLQAQLFGPGGQAEWARSQASNVSGGLGATLGSHKPYKIKRFIDEMYQKEAKSRYHRQYVREDFLLTQSPIFDLGKYHQLRPQGELMPRGGRNRFGGLDGEVAALGVDKRGNPVFPSESQSLTNVMGFQAGGVSLLSPAMKNANPDLQLQMLGQLNSHSDLPSAVGIHEPANTMWNRGLPPLGERGGGDDALPLDAAGASEGMRAGAPAGIDQ